MVINYVFKKIEPLELLVIGELSRYISILKDSSVPRIWWTLVSFEYFYLQYDRLFQLQAFDCVSSL